MPVHSMRYTIFQPKTTVMDTPDIAIPNVQLWLHHNSNWQLEAGYFISGKALFRLVIL
ncbi:hypothetical protein VCRA2116O30_400023 [Vibrio crassostreae]|nr:hypothetical protein VCRA2116O26_390014 [Vibrio crassostreae]CAK2063278.1 hypothetical protein VCRA2113O22_390014 [Vibrio crassostreae]CAK2064638.1 hypothetical protein VCRA2113O20_390013 [Vibrio crassostreae]CAK2065259.1 hypothetical protein VCRA2117O40_370014 [Vibrio crassostreae]CAK2072168.1 hypothetical protein VCRA2119O46_370014 [Vibrio crassostreae]